MEHCIEVLPKIAAVLGGLFICKRIKTKILSGCLIYMCSIIISIIIMLIFLAINVPDYFDNIDHIAQGIIVEVEI